MPNFKCIITSVIGLSLIGCASMSEDECLSADWYTIGFEDGSRGYAPNHIGNHRKSCAKHGVTPSFESYSKGHARGLTHYCVPNTAFNLGSEGRIFPQICLSLSTPEMEEAFELGRDAYAVQQEISQLAKTREDLEQESNQLRLELKENEDRIVADETAPEERRRLMRVNRTLEATLASLENELHELELLIQHKQEERRAIHW